MRRIFAMLLAMAMATLAEPGLAYQQKAEQSAVTLTTDDSGTDTGPSHPGPTNPNGPAG